MSSDALAPAVRPPYDGDEPTPRPPHGSTPSMHSTRRTISWLGAILFAVATSSCGDDPSAPPPDDVTPPPGDDHTPPESVGDLALTYDDATGNAILSWTAPRDDASHDRVEHYQIRYSNMFPLDWWTADNVDDPPVPLAQGAPQEYTIVDPARRHDLYAAIRSVDANGNVSPVSSVAYVRVPGYSFAATCVDAVTRAPVAGLDVHIQEYFAHDFVTGADGRVFVGDVIGDLSIHVERGASTANYHSLDDAFVIDGFYDVTYPMIEFVPADNAPYTSVLQIVSDAVVGPEAALKTWQSLPVPWYAPAFVNANGLDYYDAAARAAAHWNDATGLPLFVAVATPPVSGVTLEFLPPAQMGGQNGITSYGSDAQGYPLLDRIRIVDTFSDSAKLYAIMLHEIGHTIRLDHLASPNMIMFASQPLPSEISRDEIRAVQLMHALPNGTNLGVYDLLPPSSR